MGCSSSRTVHKKNGVAASEMPLHGKTKLRFARHSGSTARPTAPTASTPLARLPSQPDAMQDTRDLLLGNGKDDEISRIGGFPEVSSPSLPVISMRRQSVSATMGSSTDCGRQTSFLACWSSPSELQMSVEEIGIDSSNASSDNTMDRSTPRLPGPSPWQLSVPDECGQAADSSEVMSGFLSPEVSAESLLALQRIPRSATTCWRMSVSTAPLSMDNHLIIRPLTLHSAETRSLQQRISTRGHNYMYLRSETPSESEVPPFDVWQEVKINDPAADGVDHSPEDIEDISAMTTVDGCHRSHLPSRNRQRRGPSLVNPFDVAKAPIRRRIQLRKSSNVSAEEVRTPLARSVPLLPTPRHPRKSPRDSPRRCGGRLAVTPSSTGDSTGQRTTACTPELDDRAVTAADDTPVKCGGGGCRVSDTSVQRARQHPWSVSKKGRCVRSSQKSTASQKVTLRKACTRPLYILKWNPTRLKPRSALYNLWYFFRPYIGGPSLRNHGLRRVLVKKISKPPPTIAKSKPQEIRRRFSETSLVAPRTSDAPVPTQLGDGLDPVNTVSCDTGVSKTKTIAAQGNKALLPKRGHKPLATTTNMKQQLARRRRGLRSMSPFFSAAVTVYPKGRERSRIASRRRGGPK